MSSDEASSKISYFWCDVLGVDTVDDSSDFFAEGGDSMDAIILLQSINDHFSIDLMVEDIFRSPDFGSIARAVRLRLPDAGEDAGTPPGSGGKSPQDVSGSSAS